MERPPNSVVKRPILVRGENPAFGVFEVTRRELRNAVSAGVRVFPVVRSEVKGAADVKGIVDTICALPTREAREGTAKAYVEELRSLPQVPSVRDAIETIEGRFLKGEAGGKRERMETAPGQVAGRAKEGGGRSEIELRGLFM